MANQLYRAVADSEGVVDFLNRLTKIAVEVLSEQEREVYCGITLLRPRRAQTVASSSKQAQQMDEVQYQFDDGPCLTAARQEREVYIPDVKGLPADSKYRQAMENQGIRSVLAVPIILPADTYSALNLYSDQRDAFDARSRRFAHRFAAEAGNFLDIASHVESLVDTGTDLRAAIENRSAIDTAVGIIMGENKCSQDEAITILRQAASTRHIKLRDLARNIIAAFATNPPTTP
ncbi:GAF and ANTAR domain-containing protein [Arthrobacter agilis]|uniref:GAF and ANTAR domain-containing protein n=1 Tax=Arthrobacter agilis TaxID=37921 RepID=UPI0027D81BA7|nr:GAF and ANTAR domain-containing protein [Arthrobacter agilis]